MSERFGISSPDTDPGQYLRDLGMSFRPAVILLAANRIGLFHALQNRTLSAEHIAAELGADLRATRILLHALAALHLLEKSEAGFRIPTALQPYLMEGRPEYLGDMLRHDFNLLKRWIELPNIVKSGRPAERTEARGSGEEHRDFILAMANLGWRNAEAFARAVDMSGVTHLLDLGGGPAVFAIVLCRHYPDLRVTVFDTPETIVIARDHIRRHGLDSRIGTQAGDFMTDDIQGRYDAVLLSSIVHIYGPEQNQQLLRNVANVLLPGGRVFIRDFILDETRTSPPGAALFAVNMLVNTKQGNCYTEKEIRDWLQGAGLQFKTRISLPGESHIIEGRKEG